jgi:uncharacterized protein YdhG (YjbR/CyaY superfamily)
VEDMTLTPMRWLNARTRGRSWLSAPHPRAYAVAIDDFASLRPSTLQFCSLGEVEMTTSAVDGYLAALPPDQKASLEQLRATIRAAVPAAEETISTGVPAFLYRGKYLVSFSAAKQHLALLVMQGDIVGKLGDELAAFDTGKRIIRFTPDKPFPAPLVKRIVEIRAKQIEGGV